MKNYKLLTLFLVLNITFQFLSDTTAGKIIDLFGIGVAVTVVYFPITYIISDIITEIYGYVAAKRVLQYTLLSSVIMGIVTQIMLKIPSAPYFKNDAAYETVFSVVPMILMAVGWLYTLVIFLIIIF